MFLGRTEWLIFPLRASAYMLLFKTYKAAEKTLSLERACRDDCWRTFTVRLGEDQETLLNFTPFSWGFDSLWDDSLSHKRFLGAHTDYILHKTATFKTRPLPPPQ